MDNHAAMNHYLSQLQAKSFSIWRYRIMQRIKTRRHYLKSILGRYLHRLARFFFLRKKQRKAFQLGGLWGGKKLVDLRAQMFAAFLGNVRSKRISARTAESVRIRHRRSILRRLFIG